MRDPFSCYRSWKRRFGNTFVVNALNGDVVATCDRENIRRAFAASFDDVEPFAVETVRPLVGGSSVFLLQGERHRRERTILSPPFHGKSTGRRADEIRDIALRVAGNWQAGQTIRIMDASLDVSLEVIIRIVFGVQSQEEVEQFKQHVKRFVRSFHPVLAFTRMFQRPLLGLSPWNRFIAERSRFYRLLDEQIRRRRNEGGNQDSVLTQLIRSRYEDGSQADDESIRDQLVTLLFAGHETTQIAIAWAMSWLARKSEIADRLRSELDRDDSLEAVLQSELIDGICNESLRLNAIVPDTVRTLRVPMTWTDVELPAGSHIAIAICLVHEDPELYPAPFEFDPDRWSRRIFKPNEFLPFGGGVRRCIGAPLAVLEMKIVIATWWRHFRFELPTDAPHVEPLHRRNVTMAPVSGIPLVFPGPRGNE